MGKFKTYLVTAIIIGFTLTQAQTPGTATVKTWANNNESAFSFSFDDGLQSHYDNAAPILEEFGFRGSFYVVSSVMNDNLPGSWRYGVWSQFRELAQNGHEIGSHTVTHADLTELPEGDIYTPGTLHYELYQSQSKIREKIPEAECLTLAYPYTLSNDFVINITKNYYESARDNGQVPNNPYIFGNDFYKLTSEEMLFDEPRNSPQDDLDELYEFQNYIESSIENNQWSVLLAHEVVPFTEIEDLLNQNLWYPMSNEWLSELAGWLKNKSDNKDVWVETIENITKYIKERNSFQYYLLSINNQQIKLNVTDNLNDDIYNYPLTVDFTVPQDWQSVIITQGNYTDTLNTMVENGNYYVRANVIPDNGHIILNKFSPGGQTFAISGTVKYNNYNEDPLYNVTVQLSGPGGIEFSTNTTHSGTYSFTGLPSGDYTLSFSKDEDWNGVNSTDALLTQRFFAGLSDLDELQQIAADVNNSGTVNTTDALLIQKRFLNLIQTFSKPDWVFLHNNVNVTITNSNKVQNNYGMATGDVNGSFTPPPANNKMAENFKGRINN